MPEMLEYCGKRFRVYKRAHKTCDPGTMTGSRRMEDTVHLDQIRCNGAAHGGCQAGCLIFWKEMWLKRVDDLGTPERSQGEGNTIGCTKKEVWAAAQTKTADDTDEPRFVCQATQLPYATTP